MRAFLWAKKCADVNMWFVVFFMSMSMKTQDSCHLSRGKLNKMRIQSEELERLLHMWGTDDIRAQNRSKKLVSELVESLWYCV